MTLRAFLVGLLFVCGIALVGPYNDFGLGNAYVTGFHFPVGAFFLFVLLTLVGNLALKLLRKGWELCQSELLLVWAMMIVACTVPGSGLMRYLHPTIAAPGYYADSQEYAEWAERGHVLSATPEELVLSKKPGDYASEQFFHGFEEDGTDIQWNRWAKPLVHWGIFLMLYYLCTMFLCSILRKRWVEEERLTFPLVQVPLELTGGDDTGGRGIGIFTNRMFLIGAGISLLAGAVRLSPIMETAGFQLGQIMEGTSLEGGQFGWAVIYPLAVGFAYLLPAQISFSIWFFWLLCHLEFLTADQAGAPLSGGITGSSFVKWQQAGAFLAFTLVLLWKARRHIASVVRMAFGCGADVDDSDEPVGYKVSFWGFVLTFAAIIGWFWYFEVNPFIALLLTTLILSLVLVHARLVAQGGLFFVQQNWSPLEVAHGITGGYAMSAPAIVIASMQNSILFSDARELFSPHAMNAFRISSVFKKHRRYFMPAMLSALVVALLVGGWSAMQVYHAEGAYNIQNTYGPQTLAPETFETAERLILRPEQQGQINLFPFTGGAVAVVGLMLLRLKYFWWPIHPIGILIAGSYAVEMLWLSFFLGWFIKNITVYLGGGKGLRMGRHFFFGIIAMEASLVGICALVGLITGDPIGSSVLLPA